MKISGIYKIISPTGAVYIGQSYDIYKRWAQHRCKQKLSKGVSLINRSLQKYGASAHAFSVIHEASNLSHKETLTDYEQLYIDYYRALGYSILNLLPAVNNIMGTKHGPCSESTKNKISKANAGNKHTLGKRYSKEVKLKYSLAKIGNQNNLGKKYDLNSRLKRSKSAMGKTSNLKPENVLHIVHLRFEEKKELKEIAAIYRMSMPGISNIVNGYTWCHVTGIVSKNKKNYELFTKSGGEITKTGI